MSKKRNDDINVSFESSGSAEDVTGSMVHVEYQGYNILMDCGAIQGGSILDEYRANSKQFKFKAKSIDCVIITHGNFDHIGALPTLYRRGCTGKIFIPQGSRQILYEMLANSSFINEGNAKFLSKKFEKEFEPLYTEKDVCYMMQFVEEQPFYEMVWLNDDIRFKFISAGHIAFSSSIILEIKKSQLWKRIYYTGDLGNTLFKNYYTNNIDKITNADLVISECTYSTPEQSCANKDQRDKDRQKLKSTIDQYNKIWIPVFSLHRSQVVLSELAFLFKDDPNFKVPIYVDSILLSKICDIYKKQFPQFEEITRWENVRFITKEHREAVVASGEKCIILSSSGMVTAGSSVFYASHLIGNPNAVYVSCGYASEGSIASKLKMTEKEQKTITINGKSVKNKIQVVKLRSFSNHMQYNQLLQYLSEINSNMMVLHHGNQMGKIYFKSQLELIYEKLCKTTSVKVSNKSMKIHL